jgi:hypothetical protein
MAKAKIDPVREDRIQNEAIVDAYGPEEQAMGWYYYLQDRISFPFQARCMASMLTSPLRKGEKLEVLGMAPEEACDADMLIQIQWQGRRMAVPLSQLVGLDVDDIPRKLSPIGITGLRKAVVSDLRTVAENSRFNSS